MFLPQTMEEYLDNPMGRGSTAITNRNLIKSDLDSRYNKLIEKHKDFEHKDLFDGKNFYFHIKVPSESERSNTYDVVIEFTQLDEDFSKDINLSRYYIKVFSNCPSFIFTFAYVYDEYEMIISELKNKYDDIVFKNNPIIKNPGEIINFEKSIYFACKYLSMHKALMNKIILAKNTRMFVKQYFEKNIRNTDIIMREIKKENNRLMEEKKKKESNIKKQQKEEPTTHKKNKVMGSGKLQRKNIISPQPKIKPKAKIKPHK